MDTFWLGIACFCGVFLGGIAIVGSCALIAWIVNSKPPAAEPTPAAGGAKASLPVLEAHFQPQPVDTLRLTRREFPQPVRVDIQRAIEEWLAAHATDVTVQGAYVRYAHLGTSFNELIQRDDAATLGPPRYDDVEIGDDQPAQCLTSGLWLARTGGQPIVVLIASSTNFGRVTPPIQVEIAVGSKEQLPVAQQIFAAIEEGVRRSATYRGKIVSLETADQFTGTISGFSIHKLTPIERDALVLPAATIAAIDRNIVDFVNSRDALRARGLSAKKGLLFHGPPGTGKTHTIRYLAGALPGHTILLATAEQMGQIANYIALARLLQPSVLVLEDVDLIGGHREGAEVCTEALLNRLLNEMDGLKEDAAVLFIMTTNRPEALEDALAARPGRVDQAIEFPLPDGEGREKLVRLYSRGLEMDDSVLASIVERCDGVSAAFLKELMRRSYQYQLAAGDGARLERASVEDALEEMMEQGGHLNRRLFNLNGNGMGFPVEKRDGRPAPR